MRQIAAAETDVAVRLLGGTDVGYAKLTRRWWQPIGRILVERKLEGRPIYFVSSNLHGMVDLASGYAPRRAQTLWSFLGSRSLSFEGMDSTHASRVAILRRF